MSEISETLRSSPCGTTPTTTCSPGSVASPWASPGRACLPASASSREASPARTSPILAGVQGSQVSAADSGERWYASFAVYDPTTSSWRTLQRCLDGGWEPFSGTWLKAGTMRNGVCSTQVTWERRISGRESFLWPTPLAAPPRHRLDELVGAGRAPLSPEKRWFNRRTGKSVQKGLEQVVQVYAQQQTSTAGRRRRRRMDRWPGNGETTHQGVGGQSIHAGGTCGGRLNPAWVEALMGYPPGWTVHAGPPGRGSPNTPGSRHG